MLGQFISRVRRNHGLEHATIHVLSEKYRNFSAQGNSNHRGFYLNIYGEIGEQAVMDAVEDAFRRMKRGEHHLAVHPNCGTVLLTTAAMTTLATQLVFGLEQRRQKRVGFDLFFNAFPSAVLAGVVALIVSRPVGIALQAKFTTEGDLGNLQISRIERIAPSPVTRLFQLLLAPGRELKTTAYRIETIG